MRDLTFEEGYLKYADGSCMLTMGNTKILTSATILEEAPKFALDKGWGWVSAEYGMLPCSTDIRTPRQKTSTSGRTQEISRLIGRSLRAGCDLTLLAPYHILIDCDVIQADGGTRVASINGGFISMSQAINKLLVDGKIKTSPIKNYVAAISVGIVNDEFVVDLTQSYDQIAQVDVNIVMNDEEKLIELQATAEGRSFSEEELNKLIKLASTEIKIIIKKQSEIIKKIFDFK